MQFTRKKFAAVTAVAAMSVASLAFAAETHGGRNFHRHGALMQVLTDSQKTQAKSVFQQARQAAKPVREQLMTTRKSLRAAVEAGNTAQIQQLSASEGQEIGQLMAIRSSAFSKVYQTLSPDQKAKLAEIQQARAQARHARHPGAAKSAS
jgi:Spy/CpxP family protein refolding chaperone